MWRKLIASLADLAASAFDGPESGPAKPGDVAIVLSNEQGWTEAEKNAAKAAGLNHLLDTAREDGVIPSQIVVTRAMAAAIVKEQAEEEAEHAHRIRKQAIELDQEAEWHALQQLELWAETREKPPEEELRLRAIERTLLEVGPSSMAALHSIREKHDIDSLGTYFEAFDRPGEVARSYPVEFYRFAGRDGYEIGFVAHDPGGGYRDWKVAINNYTESDARFEQGGSFPDWLGDHVEIHLETTADYYGDDEDEEDEPEDGDELVKVLPLLNKEFGFQFPADSSKPFWKTGEKIKWGAGHTQPEAVKPAGETYPTLDSLEVLVPEGTLDREFLDSLDWPEPYEFGFRSNTLSTTLLTTALERLEHGETGTALVILRNYFSVLLNAKHPRDGMESRMQLFEIASDLLVDTYLALDRPTLAGRALERKRLRAEGR